jgi:predicted small metal-binding protein
VKRPRGRPRYDDRDVTPRARQMRLRRLLKKGAFNNDREFHEFWQAYLWVKHPRETKKFYNELEKRYCGGRRTKAQKEKGDEILRRIDQHVRRLHEIDQMKKREIEEFKEFMRNKTGFTPRNL